jgi:hypothetical protein
MRCNSCFEFKRTLFESPTRGGMSCIREVVVFLTRQSNFGITKWTDSVAPKSPPNLLWAYDFLFVNRWCSSVHLTSALDGRFTPEEVDSHNHGAECWLHSWS